jgi:hypothetical protein
MSKLVERVLCGMLGGFFGYTAMTIALNQDSWVAGVALVLGAIIITSLWAILITFVGAYTRGEL